MSLTYQRSRITGAGLVAAQYDLTLERQTIMDNILFIPGIANPVSEINQLLFGQGQQGTFIAPSLTASLISGSTFGTGVETLPDLSPRNNPFSQANSGNRAAWFREPKTGRRNLILHSQDRGDAYWVNINTSVTPNAAIAPDGTLTADKIIVDNGETFSTFNTTNRSGALTLEVGLRYIVSFFAKPDGFDRVSVRMSTGTSMGTSPILSKVVNMEDNTDTGTIGSYLGRTPAANGYFRYFFRTIQAATDTNYLATTSFDSVATVGNGVDGVLVWGIQIEPENPELFPTAYQRVTTAFDVTEAGQRDCFGVRADGTDDEYATASIDFTGTNKVTVFAAIRKQSDAGVGSLLHLGAGATAEGLFAMIAPSSGSANNYRFRSRGNTNADSTATSFTSPTTNILTGIGDIGGPLSQIRVDGVVRGTNTNSQGPGNYRNDVLYLFQRNGLTPFNGNLYALIVAGGSYPLSTIQRVERILSRITPTVNL